MSKELIKKYVTRFIYQRKWVLNNKDKCREYKISYYLKNRQKVISSSREWERRNKDRYLKKIRERRKKNPKKHRIANKKWSKRNSIKVRLKNNRHYHRTKYNILVLLKRRLRARLATALSGRGVKVTLTQVYLGCSYAFFYQYIDTLLKEARKTDKRMTWKNKGKWHLDHIKPVASFDFSKIEEQFSCFNWSNIQPLWGTENRLKSCKY